MFRYTAYTLGIHSAIALPELAAAESAPDVTVRTGAFPLPPPSGQEMRCETSDEETRVLYERVGAFQVRSGQEVTVDPSPEAEDGMVRWFLLTRVLGILLQQRGALVLHSSAVLIQGRAVVFLGEWGAGKSTLAAAFYDRGYPVLADDLVAVQFTDAGCFVLPSFPRLRILPETAQRLESFLRQNPLADSTRGKGLYPVDRGFPTTPVPLQQVYLLHPGPHLEAEPLTTTGGFSNLVAHQYVSRLLLGEEAIATRFRNCVHLAESIPFARLSVPRSWDALPRAIRIVEEHSAASGA